MESYKNILENSLRENILETQNIRFLSKLALLDSSPYSITNTKYNYKVLWAIGARIRELQDAPKQKRITLNLIDTRTGLEIYTQSIEVVDDLNKLDEFNVKFIRTIEKRINQY